MREKYKFSYAIYVTSTDVTKKNLEVRTKNNG